MSLDVLFKVVAKREASDLHLAVGLPPVLRIDGELEEISAHTALTEKSMKELIFGILDREQEEKFEREKELDFAHEIEDGTRFRVNLFFEKGNMSLAARLIPQEVPTMEDLDMPEIAYELARKPHGLVLVTGPTGSGKSTTLAAMVDLVNKEESVNIITLEDPIEFLFKPDKAVIRQRQVGFDTLNFAESLRRVLRQDPDVVMVGEMRDLETIATALTLAETGHLVFATLHTWSAAQTIDRIIDSFPEHQQTQIRMQLALTLRGIISQQLLSQIGGGRVAAREILVNTPAVGNLIRENKIVQINTILETNAKLGMVSLKQDLRRLLKENKIEKEIAETYAMGAMED